MKVTLAFLFLALPAAGAIPARTSQGAEEETFTVTLSFEKMHCQECQAELQALLARLPGFASHAFSGSTVKVTLKESAPIPSFNRLPRDLRMKRIGIDARGTVGFSGDKATFVAKGSGATLALVNPKEAGKLPELRKKTGGKNRFRIKGRLIDGRTIELESFTAVDWKD